MWGEKGRFEQQEKTKRGNHNKWTWEKKTGGENEDEATKTSTSYGDDWRIDVRGKVLRRYREFFFLVGSA